MQRKSHRSGEVHGIGSKVAGGTAFHLDLLKLLKAANLYSELVAQELAEPWNTERASETNDLRDRLVRMQRLVVTHGALHFLQQVIKDRAHGMHQLLGVFVRSGFGLQAVCLAVGNTECRCDRFGEVVTADWEGANPATTIFDHHQVTGARSNIKECHHWIAGAIQTTVIDHGVVDSDRAHGHASGTNAKLLVETQPLCDFLLKNCENTHFVLRGIFAGKEVVIPFNLFEREWNLLLGFKENGLRNGLLWDRRKLGKPGETVVARDPHHDRDALDGLLLHERTQGDAEHFLNVQIGRGEHLGMRNDHEVRDADFGSVALKANGLDCGASDLDTPCCLCFCHVTSGSCLR